LFWFAAVLNDEINLMVRKINKLSLTSINIFLAHLMQDCDPKAQKNPEINKIIF